MTKPPANVLNLPLEQRAEMALKAAVERVLVEHARQGLPIYIWRDGKVVELPPNCGHKQPPWKRNRPRKRDRFMPRAGNISFAALH